MWWLNTELALAAAIFGLLAAVAVSCDSTPPDMEIVNVNGSDN